MKGKIRGSRQEVCQGLIRKYSRNFVWIAKKKMKRKTVFTKQKKTNIAGYLLLTDWQCSFYVSLYRKFVSHISLAKCMPFYWMSIERQTDNPKSLKKKKYVKCNLFVQITPLPQSTGCTIFYVGIWKLKYFVKKSIIFYIWFIIYLDYFMKTTSIKLPLLATQN